jgi:hypothetical protein
MKQADEIVRRWRRDRVAAPPATAADMRSLEEAAKSSIPEPLREIFARSNGTLDAAMDDASFSFLPTSSCRIEEGSIESLRHRCSVVVFVDYLAGSWRYGFAVDSKDVWCDGLSPAVRVSGTLEEFLERYLSAPETLHPVASPPRRPAYR